MVNNGKRSGRGRSPIVKQEVSASPTQSWSRAFYNEMDKKAWRRYVFFFSERKPRPQLWPCSHSAHMYAHMQVRPHTQSGPLLICVKKHNKRKFTDIPGIILFHTSTELAILALSYISIANLIHIPKGQLASKSKWRMSPFPSGLFWCEMQSHWL